MFFKNQRIGKYQILDTIGSGGFGSVYLAKDVWIDKKVAIKVPHKQGENFDKLLQEPRLLAALNHPNIVSVITAEKTNDVFFIVMEYVDGTSLEQYLRRQKRLEPAPALDWFIAIGDAIAYAHSKNILHRDIRPANVLISNDRQVKLADLGTSRYLLDDPFAPTRIGSPPYMSPEHFQGKATFQSDIYSFGILMYECLTGTLPFFDKNPQRLAKIAKEGRFKMPSAHNPAVPARLNQVICRAMHRLLGSRYQSAADLVSDLREMRDLMRHGSIEAARDKSVSPHGDTRDWDTTSDLEETPSKEPVLRDLRTREISSLFCWNCSRPIQRRTRQCPNCNVSLK